MGDIVFNISKGRIRSYADLSLANDALVLVLLKSAGLESDAVLKDYDTLAAILAATNDECDFTGYARRNLAGVVINVDDVNDRVDLDATDPAAYTNTGGASQQSGKAVLCYDPDTTGGTDADLVPIFAYDCVMTFDIGVASTVAFNASGFGRAA